MAGAARSNTLDPAIATPSTKTHTTKEPGPTDPVMTQGEIYLWLPLIAVVVFTGIMVILILIGRSRVQNTSQGDRNQMTEVTGRGCSTGLTNGPRCVWFGRWWYVACGMWPGQMHCIGLLCQEQRGQKEVHTCFAETLFEVLRPLFSNPTCRVQCMYSNMVDLGSGEEGLSALRDCATSFFFEHFHNCTSCVCWGEVNINYLLLKLTFMRLKLIFMRNSGISQEVGRDVTCQPG